MGRAVRLRSPAEEPHHSVKDLERALAFVAYIITRHGTVYTPIFDFLESELLKERAKADPMSRARQVLEAYTIDGTAKAIR